MNRRSELQREVAAALIESKAINFDAINSVLTKYATRAALSGDAIGVIINHRLIDVCIPVPWETIVGNVRSQVLEDVHA
jgi:hypothetical protein